MFAVSCFFVNLSVIVYSLYAMTTEPWVMAVQAVAQSIITIAVIDSHRKKGRKNADSV